MEILRHKNLVSYDNFFILRIYRLAFVFTYTLCPLYSYVCGLCAYARLHKGALLKRFQSDVKNRGGQINGR